MTPCEHFDAERLIASPEVSVVMLVYNHEPYLAAAIESVLQQCADVALELIIGEDCSTDRSMTVAQEYRARFPEAVRIVSASGNVGLWANYRRVLEAARGRFIAHLDGDDRWLPGKLAAQLACLRAHPDCAAIYTDAHVVDAHDRPLGSFNGAGDRRVALAALLRTGNFLNMSSMLFRTELRAALLEIDRPFIDYRVHLRHARGGDLLQIGEALTVYRQGSGSSMMRAAGDRVRAMYWEAIIDVPRERISAAELEWGLADFLRRVLLHAVRHRRWELFAEWAARVAAQAPHGRWRIAAKVAVRVAKAGWAHFRWKVRGRRVLYPE